MQSTVKSLWKEILAPCGNCRDNLISITKKKKTQIKTSSGTTIVQYADWLIIACSLQGCANPSHLCQTGASPTSTTTQCWVRVVWHFTTVTALLELVRVMGAGVG